MIYTELTIRAMQTAYIAHMGQADKAGVPYIFHPYHVAEQMTDEYAVCAALLHDVVEDTGLSLCDIERQFGPETAAAIDAISRREDEPWGKYLERVKHNPIARAVKISDLIDNSNLSRLENITLTDVRRQEKYNRALQFLMTD